MLRKETLRVSRIIRCARGTGEGHHLWPKVSLLTPVPRKDIKSAKV